MSKLDIAKETIAYLKFWLGVMVVSDISLVGWFLSNAESAPNVKTYGAVVAVGAITFCAVLIHKRIERIISTLEDL